MSIPDSKVAHLMPLKNVEIGTKLLFINKPNSWSPNKKNFVPVAYNFSNAVVGIVKSKPKFNSVQWIFYIDLQADSIQLYECDSLVAIVKE